MFDRKAFEDERKRHAAAQNEDGALQKLALTFLEKADRLNYFYHWNWLGLPIIQSPEDIIAVQEIIWETQPDLIIETGIAWGGSVVLYASILELIGKGRVAAIDKVLPETNIQSIMKYPFSKRIHLFEGSSTDPSIFQQVRDLIKPEDKVMVLLDSNHTHEHVYDELELWGPLVSKGQYLVVSDTLVEDIPAQTHRPRPWGPGNNPKTAVQKYLQETDRFTLANSYHQKALLSCTRDGYLKCIA